MDGSERQNATHEEHDPQTLHIWSCIACRRRKVKCDRGEPCTTCAKNSLECYYPVAGRLPNRIRAPQWSSAHQKQTDLLARLQRLEAVVAELSAQVDDANDSSYLAPPPPKGAECTTPQRASHVHTTPSSSTATVVSSAVGPDMEPGSEDFGRLVTDAHGRVRIAKSFWSVFCEEVDHIFQSIQNASDIAEEAVNSNDQTPASTCCCHAFGLGADGTGPMEGVQTSPTEIMFLLQTFKERVDPFVKILTLDSLKSLLDLWSLPQWEIQPAQRALRASALFAAAVSLSATEAVSAFQKPKTTLLAELKQDAERFLAQAKYLSTTDLTVLQALVIYASMLPYAGMQNIAGPIVASTVQIAVQNGIHLEERRKRHANPDAQLMTWLQICFLSTRFQAADAAASHWPLDTPPANEFSAKIGGINDELWTLLLTRQTIRQLSRELRPPGQSRDDDQIEALIRAAQSKIENQYEKGLHKRDTNPLSSFVQKMTDLFFAKLQHALLAKRWQGQLDKGHIFAQSPPPHGQTIARGLSEATMATLEAIQALNTRPEWTPWRWQLQGFFPWAAMRLVFAHFCDAVWTPLAERAWVLAQAVASSVSDEVRTDPAWPSLCALMEAAAAHRDKEMARLMASALENGDFMQIIEAGQRLFYGHGGDGPCEGEEVALKEPSAPSSIGGGNFLVNELGRNSNRHSALESCVPDTGEPHLHGADNLAYSWSDAGLDMDTTAW